MNIFGYNMMIGMVVMGAVNFLLCYYGPHTIKDTSFAMKDVRHFVWDKYYDEEIASFQFDLKTDISGLINWNTNIIFTSIVCEFETPASKTNFVTVWDQRIKREETEHH